MCTVLDIPRSTYYAKKNKSKSNRDKENKKLKSMIMDIYIESKQRYGSPKITKLLNKALIKQDLRSVSQKRVQRLMNELGIKSIIVKKFKPHSKSSSYNLGENVLNQDFSTTTINQKWVADITYIYTINHGWCYLASVEDLHTRKIIGKEFSKNIDSELVIKALQKAYKNQNPGPGVIFHSDRGTQYTSNDFINKLNEYEMIQSLSNKGNPYDNASIESFHSIIKKEYVHHTKYRTFDEARLGLFDYIEGWYNRNRIHGAIDYLTPHEYEIMIRKSA